MEGGRSRGVCFCLSKARDPQAAAAAPSCPAHPLGAALRAELLLLPPSQLRKRAAAAGVADAAIEAAEDAAAPKEAMVELVLANETAGDEALRAELQGLTPSQLRKRAAASGAANAAVEAAEDSAAPKEAMIELIVAAEGGADAALRAELGELAPSQLRKRAAAAGAADAAIEAAEDSTSPKDAMIELIVGAGGDYSAAPPQPGPEAPGKADDAEAAAEAETTEPQDRPHFGVADPQPPQPRSTGPRSIIPNGKHAMLSYQWDHQAVVRKANKALQARGVQCWMDVDGGMQSDIYDSMAQGVQGAAVVICFLSQQYQLSENCKLELKFACQTGIPIVPVMLEDDRAEGWRPSEWLGVITAGALWTPLSADSGFDQSITNLIVQLQAGIGSTFTDMSLSSTDQKFQEEFQEEEGGAHEKEKASMSSATVIPAEYVVATVVADDDMFTLDEMREELERLRAESHQSGTHLTRGAGEECALPAMLPEARDGLVVSDSMHKLVDTVISVTSKRCCGFWGSGGIGKTTTSAWLCRQERVRRHFDLIVWLTLSQTPNVLACQRQLFTQLTGQELAQELSEEDRVVAIQEAFLGKHCLLVLDDCWDVGHLSHFALVDESTRSRVLISSRVVSTLENCEVVDIGLPTEQDAIQIVMAAAGMANGAAVPEEAREVARLCKLLPLTLGIAGRLIKGLELQHDWSEVVAMMKEELSVDGEARSAEDGVIATSLRAIKGRDADSARALFKAFRLVPEDVKIPLEALACVYEASNAAEEATAASSSGSDGGGGSSPRGPSGPPTMLQLRKWTKLLIERCLVLGPIDQPSLHDMVGDFSSSMSSQEVTCAAHRRLVNLFRERRPEPAGWDELETEGRLAKYVIKHCGCHISASWMPDWRSDEEAISWLEDFKISQDAIPFAAAQFLGTERVSELARESEGKADWWSASLRWSATALENRVSAGTHVSQPLFQACAAALEHHQPTTPEGIDAKQRLELTTIFGVLTNWDANAVSTYLPRLNALQDSAAAKANPDTLAAVFLMNEFSLEFWSVERKGAGTASELRFGKQSFQYMNYFIEAAQAEPVGSRKRNKLLALAFAMNVGTSFQDMMIESMLNSGGPDAHEPSPDGIWDRAFGAGGCLLNEASMVYDYESHHKILLSTQSWDGCLRPSHVLALYLRWGDLANANANAEKALRNFKRFMTQSSPDGNTQMFTLAEWPSMLYLLGRSEDVVEFMRENRVDWSHAAETALAIGQVTSFVGQMETEGPTKSGMFNDSRDWVWTCKSIWLLAAMATTTAANGTQTEEELAEQTEQFLDTLPAADELARFGIWRDQDGQPRFHAARGMLNITSLVWPALVLETLGQGEKALAYATQALNVDHTTGGGNGAPLRTLAHRCCGRVLAGQGKMDEARAAFEAAEALAAKRGYWMLEALARRDLLEHVSTPAAGGELELAGGGQQKKLLAPLVARLTGPKEALAELLGKDYVELL